MGESGIYVCVVCTVQRKMDEHVVQVGDFQSMMATHGDWIAAAEQTLASFKHPSKLVDRVLQQIDEHKVTRTISPCTSVS